MDRWGQPVSQPQIRALNSRVVYENKWMTVREDDVIRADGSTGIFGVVEKPDFALVIPFDGHGFSVVEQYRHPVDPSSASPYSRGGQGTHRRSRRSL
jgi:hypothetical protein